MTIALETCLVNLMRKGMEVGGSSTGPRAMPLVNL